MSKRFALPASLLALLACFPGALAASPADRLLGTSDLFDPSPYSEQDLDEEKQFAPESLGDSDLGEQFILRRYSQRTPVRFRMETGPFWSDNIASASRNEDDGWFWANRFDVSWRPSLGHNFYFDTSLQEDIYRYDTNALDFEAFEFRLGLVKVFPELGDLVVFGRYEFENIDSGFFFGLPDTSSQFHRLHFGAHKTFLSKPKHTAYLGGDALFDLDADPAYTEREELAVHLGYTWHPTDRLAVTTFYRSAWIDYSHVDRADLFQTAGVELTCTISEAAEIRTSFAYGNNDSDSRFGIDDYEAWQAGITASLILKW